MKSIKIISFPNRHAGLLVNGKLIQIACAEAGDDIERIFELGADIADALGTQPVTCTRTETNDDDWEWADIVADEHDKWVEEVRSQIHTQSKMEAADFVFDLNDGAINEDIAGVMRGDELYDAITTNRSCEFMKDGIHMIATPYYQTNTEYTLQLLEDTNNRIETSYLNHLGMGNI